MRVSEGCITTKKHAGQHRQLRRRLAKKAAPSDDARFSCALPSPP